MAESIARSSGAKRVLHINFIGYLIGLGVALLLLPFLPIYLALRAIDRVRRSRSPE